VGARSVILVRVLPIEKFHRAALLNDLAKRLRTLIDSWSDDAQPLSQASLLSAISPAEQRKWWSEWQKAAVAANTGKGAKRRKKAAA
jgi:hypothetical protein